MAAAQAEFSAWSGCEGAGQDGHVHADEYTLTDGAAVQRGFVSDAKVLADACPGTWVGVSNCTVFGCCWPRGW